ncbi:MAG TPA: hypothetical protein H9717_11375, partial [Candidatus Eisenbergiella merdipullorum]|nr:hypothetical protein [Candidatus Eisenbergiella merdipullorum]
DITVIYPKEELLKAREVYPELTLFFKLDTHWNYMGGYFGAQPLLKSLGIKTNNFSNISYEQINEPIFFWNGYDLARMLGLSDVLNKDINYHLYGYSNNRVTYEGDARNNVEDFNGVVKTKSSAEDNRKVFLARDSFGESITPYLAAEFSEIYSVHRASLTKSQIDAERPDIFIFEAVEREGLGGLNVENWAE